MVKRLWILSGMLVYAFLALGSLAFIVSWYVSTEQLKFEVEHDATAVQLAIDHRLDGNLDYLQLLASDRAVGEMDAAAFQIVAARYVADHPELLSITWVNREFAIKNVAPLRGNRRNLGLRLSLPEPARVSRAAADSRSPKYTTVFEAIQGKPSFEIWVPVFRDDEFVGLFAAAYSCERLLNAVVPKGLTSNHRVELHDGTNAIVAALASKSINGAARSHSAQLATTDNRLSINIVHFGRSFWNWRLILLLSVCIGMTAILVCGMLRLQRVDRDRTRTEETLREREKELAHLNRLSTMGELVAGIAHEINQPLHAISNLASASEIVLQRTDATDSGDILNWNRQISNAAVRAGDIITRLRKFTRKETGERTSVDLNDVVRESIELVSTETNSNRIEIRMDLAEPLPDVHVDGIQIQQVMVNLMSNAFDSLDGRLDESRRVVVRTLERTTTAEVIVEDNGVGLPQAETDDAFEPFFSTKRDGMGLGLAISRTIIERHGGKIWATRNDQQGMTFHFTIPKLAEC